MIFGRIVYVSLCDYVVKKLSSDKDDERIATQRKFNQGAEAGIPIILRKIMECQRDEA
jgi:hypothetical protein